MYSKFVNCTKYDSTGSFENIFALLFAWKSAKEHELLGKCLHFGLIGKVAKFASLRFAGVKTTE
jgi:hypothetical protein